MLSEHVKVESTSAQMSNTYRNEPRDQQNGSTPIVSCNLVIIDDSKMLLSVILYHLEILTYRYVFASRLKILTNNSTE